MARLPTMRAFGRRVLVLLALLLAACRVNDGMPPDWGPIEKGKDAGCPPVAGRYFDSSEPIAWLLAGRKLEWDSLPHPWAYFELAGSADSALAVTVHYLDGATDSARVQEGRDYTCTDGWLAPEPRYIPERWDDEAGTGFRANRRFVYVARGRDSSLVARLDLVTFDEFYVWCGDGCRGFPLPWTMRTRPVWSIAEAWSPDRDPPANLAGVRGQEAARAAMRRAEQDPVYWENRELEDPADPERDRVWARVASAVPPGMQLRGVGRRGEGWHLSLEFNDLSQLQALMVQLVETGPVAKVEIAPLYRAKTPTGRWTDVVYVQYAE